MLSFFAVGTLSAVGTSFVIYTMLILAFGGAFSAEVLNKDQNVFQNSTYGSKYIVVVGEYLVPFSSSLLLLLCRKALKLMRTAKEQKDHNPIACDAYDCTQHFLSLNVADSEAPLSSLTMRSFPCLILFPQQAFSSHRSAQHLAHFSAARVCCKPCRAISCSGFSSLLPMAPSMVMNRV